MNRLLTTLAVALTIAGCGDDGVVGGTGEGGSPTQGGAGGETTTDGGGGAAPSCDDLVCDGDAFCFEGACHPCDLEAGASSDQLLALGDDEEDRYFFLYVPAGLRCGEPIPLLVDFHGTAFGERPEEAYQLDSLTAMADAEGAIVVRPRSRSSEEGGLGQVYRWDQNPGDIARNVRFTENLVHALSERFQVDPTRRYASGFSSGSNMSAQFLDSEELGLFRGIAPIAGGLFGTSVANIESLRGADAPRVYASTGYRDYLLTTQRVLLDELSDKGLAPEKLWLRELNTGHDLFPWHFAEIFAFLDRGEGPVEGDLDPQWVTESPATTASFLAATRADNGDVLASASDGSVWRRSVAGAWSKLADVSNGEPIAWTGLCASPSGALFLAGEAHFSRALDGATFDAPTMLPELGAQSFGTSQLTSIACGADGTIATAGYWTGLRSGDAGESWTDLVFPVSTYEAQIASLATLPDGTLLAGGYYDHIARGAIASGDPAAVAHDGLSEWWNAIATAGTSAWVVGESGSVIVSSDGGASWVSVASGLADDLYAAGMFDASLGAVGGRRGALALSRDGGQTFETHILGVDRFVGAIVFLDASTVLVLGERGLAATLALDS